ncbi:MAG: hypothetical protein NXI10_15070 [bacterium]|nr:hypothetical protein [bacterium]
MRNFQLISTLPNQGDFHHFEDVPKRLYSKESQRFILGHDPVPSEHLNNCFVLLEDDLPIARCALYVKPGLSFQQKKACTIGSFESINDQEAAQFLLNEVVKVGKSLGFEYVIGPMEGSTWNNYRFSDHNEHANFFMEPYHHDYYGKLWQNCGFETISNYISNLDTQLVFNDERITQWEDRYNENGAVFRSLDLNDLENDLRKLAKFNNEAFQENFLFTPIAEDDFVKKYASLKKYFDPELIWVVEDQNGEIQAISFSIPDYLDASGKTLIIKSLARKKDTPFRGIGSYLAGKTYQIAAKRNFQRVIHALMIHDNNSVSISNNYEGDHYKSYSLYGMSL